jgi:hypothetical protein
LEYWEGNVGINYIALQGWKLKGDADVQIVLNFLVQLMQDNSTSLCSAWTAENHDKEHCTPSPAIEKQPGIKSC